MADNPLYGPGATGSSSLTETFEKAGGSQFHTAPTTVRERYSASEGAGDVAGGVGSGFLAGASIGAAGGPIGAVGGAVIGGLTGLTKALFTYYGNKKQNEENKRIENMNLAMYEKNEAKRAKAEAWMKEYQAKKDAEAKELMKYNKVQGFMDRLQSTLSQRKGLEAGLINAWASRSR